MPSRKNSGLEATWKLDLTIARIGAQSALQFEPGTRGNCAFFDYQLRGSRFFGDLTRDMVYRGKIGFAILFGGRAHANEDRVAAANSFGCVGGVGDPASLFCRGQNHVQMLFVNGDFAGVQASMRSVSTSVQMT